MSKTSIQLLQDKKSAAQSELTALNLEITFYNVFNKSNARARKDPNKSLICFAKSIEIRNFAFNHMTQKGYSCTKYKNYTDEEGVKSYTLKINLI
jgi:hypothetical protein